MGTNNFVNLITMEIIQMEKRLSRMLKAGAALAGVALPALALAAKATTIGGMASTLASNFNAVGKLMIGTAYIAGIGFGIAAIFKFKQHKDNPTQVPIGTPFALLAVSVLLVFLPGLYQPAAKSVFGTGSVSGGFSGAGAANIGKS